MILNLVTRFDRKVRRQRIPYNVNIKIPLGSNFLVDIQSRFNSKLCMKADSIHKPLLYRGIIGTKK